MALIFENETDSYRVVRQTSKEMLAIVVCKVFNGYKPTTPMTDEEFKMYAADAGIDAALAERAIRASGTGPAIYTELPYEECRIHPSGPLKVSDLEEILVFLRSLQPAE